jgi:hypothetical protein
VNRQDVPGLVTRQEAMRVFGITETMLKAEPGYLLILSGRGAANWNFCYPRAAIEALARARWGAQGMARRLAAAAERAAAAAAEQAARPRWAFDLLAQVWLPDEAHAEPDAARALALVLGDHWVTRLTTCFERSKDTVVQKAAYSLGLRHIFGVEPPVGRGRGPAVVTRPLHPRTSQCPNRHRLAAREVARLAWVKGLPCELGEKIARATMPVFSIRLWAWVDQLPEGEPPSRTVWGYECA